MRKNKILFALLPIVGLTACSDDLSGLKNGIGTDQNIMVSVTPENIDAHCLLNNSKGDWVISNVPSSINVYRANSALFVKCEGEHGYHGSLKVTSGFESTFLPNIWQGAIAGDESIAYKYPNKIVVPLTRDTSQDIEPSTGYAVLKPAPEPVDVTPSAPTIAPVQHKILRKKHHIVCKTTN